MKHLDFEVLEKDADDYTILLIDLWLHGVTFDRVFSRDTLSDSLYGKLRGRVLEVLSSDTQVNYAQVRHILGTSGRPGPDCMRRNGWSESNFIKEMRAQLDRVQAQLKCAEPPTPISEETATPSYNTLVPEGDPEPMRLTRYVLRNWLNNIYSDTNARQAMEKQLLPKVLSLTRQYWETPRQLPKEDVIYWFDEYMQPSTSVFIRNDWKAQDIIQDIQSSFVTLNSKVVYENQVFQNNVRNDFGHNVEQRRGKHTAIGNKNGPHY